MNRRYLRHPETIDLYLSGLTSAETKRSYRRYLEAFADAHPGRLPAEATDLDLLGFLARYQHLSPSTRAQIVTILRRYFAYLERLGIIAASPAAQLERPRRLPPEDLDVVTVTPADVDRLFAACDDWQELLTLATLAYLGPRRTASARLRQRDVDLDAGTIRFREKGGKVIVKPAPTEYLALLRAAWQEGGVPVGPAEYVIPNRRPRAVRSGERSNKIVWETVRRLAARAGVRAHPHSIRGAFAVRFDEQHPDHTLALRDLLGHRRLETTVIYLRRRDKAKSMQVVGDLSWGAAAGFGLPSQAVKAHTGFEPVLPPNRDAGPDAAGAAGSGLNPHLLAILDRLRQGAKERAR